MRYYVDNLTGNTEYIMNAAELRKYRYEILKAHKIKRKKRALKVCKNIISNLIEGIIIIIMIYGTIGAALYFS